MKPAVFIDRDGTINVEKEYLHKIEDFEFIPGADKAIKLLNDNGFLVIVVTNQSGVARGYYGENDVKKLHDHLKSRLKNIGAHFDAIYYCPHHNEKGIGKYKVECDCRKPNIGMFERARKEFDIDISNSWMIGDKIDDMKFAENAGIKGILVKTGHGKDVKGDYIKKRDIFEAIKYIINQ